VADERDPREPAVKHACPVCGYRGLWQPPYERMPPVPYPDFGDSPYAGRLGAASLEGCHRCGYQFGYDDDAGACGTPTSFRAYRQRWVAGGCRWWSSRPQPVDWSPREQMRAVGIDPDTAPRTFRADDAKD
jgi:hypothetical protein